MPRCFCSATSRNRMCGCSFITEIKTSTLFCVRVEHFTKIAFWDAYAIICMPFALYSSYMHVVHVFQHSAGIPSIVQVFLLVVIVYTPWSCCITLKRVFYDNIFVCFRILIFYDGIEMSFDMDSNLPHFKGKKKGRAYLTTHRVCNSSTTCAMTCIHTDRACTESFFLMLC